jgi:hypothetical protein
VFIYLCVSLHTGYGRSPWRENDVMTIQRIINVSTEANGCHHMNFLIKTAIEYPIITKGLTALTPEVNSDQTAKGLSVTSAVFLIAKSIW